MIQPGASDTQAVRATFVIDPEGVLRAMVYYPMTNGRSVDEIYRLVQRCRPRTPHSVATPENWQPGEDVIVPTPQTTEAAEARMAEGYDTADWYFSTRAL
jgi:peroxiredoxin (alkyl hydroperoxide reductase subunit C)